MIGRPHALRISEADLAETRYDLADVNESISARRARVKFLPPS